MNESGNVVKEESVLSNSQKSEAIEDALKDAEGKIKEMSEAVVQEQLQNAKILLRDAQAEIKRLRQGNVLMQEALEEIYKLREMCGLPCKISNSITEEQARKVYTSILKESLRKQLGEML